MQDPYETIGVRAGVDDETLRKRYLELVREFPPEKDPKKFAAIREAYDMLRDPVERVRRRVIHPCQEESLEDIIGELRSRLVGNRFPTQTLLDLADV
jgi:hypothetical protein